MPRCGVLAALAAVWAAAAAAPPPPTLRERLLAALEPLVAAAAARLNTSFSAAVHCAEAGTVRAAAGVDDHVTGTRVTADSLYPLGSVTKTWTSALAMRLSEQGAVDLDAPVGPLADAALSRWGATSLDALWAGNASAAAALRGATLRQLLEMTAGLDDYDDFTLHSWVLQNPGTDYTPFAMLRDVAAGRGAEATGGLLYAPNAGGGGAAYSSTGYNLAGLVLAAALNLTDWRDLPQMDALPPAERPHYQRTVFPARGACAEYPGVVHQWDETVDDAGKVPRDQWGGNGTRKPPRAFTDLLPASCLNGWTCGNIAAAPGDVARFYYDLFEGRLVSAASLAAMQRWKPFTTGWVPGLSYGMGLIDGYPGFHTQSSEANQTLVRLVGHGGMDYGSGGQVEGYNAAYRFGISVALNSVSGMNCSKSLMQNMYGAYNVPCAIYDTALQVVSGGAAPRLDCGIGAAPPSRRRRRGAPAPAAAATAAAVELPVIPACPSWLDG